MPMETYSRCYASVTAYVMMTPAVQQLLRPIEEATIGRWGMVQR